VHSLPNSLTRAKESTRHTVRELFATYILCVLGFILLLGQVQPGQDEASYALTGIVFSVFLFLPIWALYRLIRFALGL
jgi:Na+/melibiose symporter-like transporter